MQSLRGRFPVYTQEEVRELNNIALSFEEHIYWSATSQQDYVQKIHLKMLDLTPNIQNPMTNFLYINAANSGQNAHGPEMTMGATSYEYTSGPEESDEKQAVEEDAGDMSKEDVEEEVVVMKEQNYVVGHRENARVGENEVILILLFYFPIYFCSAFTTLLSVLSRGSIGNNFSTSSEVVHGMDCVHFTLSKPHFVGIH
ncbi:hypothetical protein P3S68_030921 [Capsicum galapagoense]